MPKQMHKWLHMRLTDQSVVVNRHLITTTNNNINSINAATFTVPTDSMNSSQPPARIQPPQRRHRQNQHYHHLHHYVLPHPTLAWTTCPTTTATATVNINTTPTTPTTTTLPWRGWRAPKLPPPPPPPLHYLGGDDAPRLPRLRPVGRPRQRLHLACDLAPPASRGCELTQQTARRVVDNRLQLTHRPAHRQGGHQVYTCVCVCVNEREGESE